MHACYRARLSICASPIWQVSAFEAYTEVWQIPLVKRLVALVSQIVFTGFTCIVFLKTQCGDLQNYHYVWFLWLGANIVSEFIHFKREPEIWLSNAFNWVRRQHSSVGPAHDQCTPFIGEIHHQRGHQ